MKKKPNSNYNISAIQKLENSGLTIRQISKIYDWQYQNCHQWIARNFKRSYDKTMKVSFTKLEKTNNTLSKITDII